MSAISSQGLQSSLTAEGSNEELIEQLVDVVNQQSKLINELQQEIEELQEDHVDHQEQTAKERAEDRKRITNVEERLDDIEDSHNPEGTTGEDTTTDGHEQPQTPLEQTVGLPERMVDQETANVQRAVFLACDVHDYTKDCPAGRVITSGDLGRVLKAGTDCQGRSQTVDRVIKILNDLGGDDVEVVERRGERRIVFTDELCHRLQELTSQPQASNTVVTGTKA